MAIALMLCSLVLILNIILENVNTRLNLSFQQRITILGRRLTDNEEKTLKSKWASMTNTDEYNEVNKQLMDIAEKYQVSLPKPF